MLGGLLLGVAEAQFAGLVNSDYKDVFSFSLLVVILIFRPQGLLAGRWSPKCEEARMNAMTQTGGIRQVLLDTLLAGAVALVVFGPVVGVVLSGYSFTLSPLRVLLVAVVMAGRLLLGLFLHTAVGRRFLRKFEATMTAYTCVNPGTARACAG